MPYGVLPGPATPSHRRRSASWGPRGDRTPPPPRRCRHRQPRRVRTSRKHRSSRYARSSPLPQPRGPCRMIHRGANDTDASPSGKGLGHGDPEAWWSPSPSLPLLQVVPAIAGSKAAHGPCANLLTVSATSWKAPRLSERGRHAVSGSAAPGDQRRRDVADQRDAHPRSRERRTLIIRADEDVLVDMVPDVQLPRTDWIAGNLDVAVREFLDLGIREGAGPATMV